MKVTLQVNGREMTFSEEELIAIVEKHLSSETTQRTTTTKVIQKPTEGAWFEVKPQTIDQKLFKKKRESSRQEAMRQLILEAFAEMKDNPEYSKNFKTMMPKKTWDSKTVTQLKKMASRLGDHNADWVEQALEWAQRIANGEPWKSICNNRDTANWYRLVVWKRGEDRIIGGSVNCGYPCPASYVGDEIFRDGYSYSGTVPLVVLYEE